MSDGGGGCCLKLDGKSHCATRFHQSHPATANPNAAMIDRVHRHQMKTNRFPYRVSTGRNSIALAGWHWLLWCVVASVCIELIDWQLKTSHFNPSQCRLHSSWLSRCCYWCCAAGRRRARRTGCVTATARAASASSATSCGGRALTTRSKRTRLSPPSIPPIASGTSKRPISRREGSAKRWNSSTSAGFSPSAVPTRVALHSPSSVSSQATNYYPRQQHPRAKSILYSFTIPWSNPIITIKQTK